MKFSRHVLPNGVRVITVPMKDNPTVTVLVMVEAGSKYESDSERGISHFLEHLCFKGTEKRPRAIDIASELDGLGSHYNAFTSYEYTGYYAKANAKHFDQLLDIVSDIYLNPRIPEDEVEREKGVIADEIRMYEDMPQSVVHEEFMRLLYGDQPAGRPVTGSIESVRSFSRDDIATYRGRAYVSGGTVVVISGGFEVRAAIRSARKAFSDLPRSARMRKIRVRDTARAPRIRTRMKETDQTHIVLGVRGLSTYDKRNPALRVLATVLGGGMSSRLFQKIRNEMGVGYYVHASVDALTDHGIFSVATGVDPSKASSVVGAIVAELEGVRRERVGDAELLKAKDHLIGTLSLNLETSDSLAEYFGIQEVMRKKLKTPGDVRREISLVDARDVQAVSRILFSRKKYYLAAVGKDHGSHTLASALTSN